MSRLPRYVTKTLGVTKVLSSVMLDRCDTCDYVSTEADLLAVRVALFGPVTNDTFRCLRHALDLDVEEAARIIGAPLENVLRWERNHARVSFDAWIRLAHRVRARAGGDPVAEAS